jgi:hypothetical protein
VVATQRAGVWQLDLGRSADSLQFHGGSGVGKRTGCIDENPALAASAFLCCAGAPRRIVWLHNRFWSSGAGRIIATRMANALELSARASRIAVHCLFPDSTCADNGDGVDASSSDRGPNVAANEFWTRNRFFVWLEHVRRGGWCCAQ